MKLFKEDDNGLFAFCPCKRIVPQKIITLTMVLDLLIIIFFGSFGVFFLFGVDISSDLQVLKDSY